MKQPDRDFHNQIVSAPVVTVRLTNFLVHDRRQGAGKFLIRRFPKADLEPELRPH